MVTKTDDSKSIFCDGFGLFNTESESLPPPGATTKEGYLRNAQGADKLTHFTSAGEKINTLFETFEFGVKRNPKAGCLGSRADINSPYVFKSYEEIKSEAMAIASYLKGLGIKPNDRVGLSGKNAPEYLTAILGSFYAGATTVPIYDTFGETECKYIIEQAEVKAIFVNSANLASISEWSKASPSVSKIIVWGAKGDDSIGNDKAVTFEQCVETGKASPVDPTPPKPEDLAVIMYTSGTTGKPKGVMLAHSTLVGTIGSTEQYFKTFGFAITSDDVFLSYLPLAHVFDFFCECLFLFLGAQIGYYRGDQKTLVDDIGELKPTFFVGVPRVFERIYKRVDGMVKSGSALKKFLFETFFEMKRKALANGKKFNEASGLGDALVFSKIKARLGGRVRIICSGGAPLAHHVEEWLKVTMCCPVVQGYGLTETCGASCVALPDRSDQLGTVGPPLFSLEVKLDPVAEMGYDGTSEGGGEICFRGPSVMKGYYKNREATDEVIESDGWFHTGDIGKIVNGCVKIVDRKKQLFKLSQGEYVSPERVEGVSGKSALVGQIFVHGTSTESMLVAVVVPTEDALAKYGGKEKAVESNELKKAILEDLNTVCRSEKLKGYEIPKGVVLHGEEFTPESGFVTPSFKLKRPFLRKYFAKQIDEVYASLN